MTVDSNSYKQFAERAKKTSDSLWCRYVLRQISTRIAWLVYRYLGPVRPDGITGLSLLVGLLGVAYIFVSPLVGVILLIAWTILDGVDGDLARATGQTTLKGGFLDAISDNLLLSVFILSCGLYGFQTFRSMTALLLGALGSIFYLLSRMTVGLRAEVLYKSGNTTDKRPLEELDEQEETFVKRIGLIVIKVYQWLVRNYNIVYLFSFPLLLESRLLLLFCLIAYQSMILFTVSNSAGIYLELGEQG